MGFDKTLLLFYFFLFVYFQHNFLYVDSRSLRLATVDTSHVSSVSKLQDIAYSGKTPELTVFIRKGGGGKGGGGRGGGGGGGKAVGRGGLRQSRGGLGGYPFLSATAHHHHNRSSGSRNLGWTGRGFGWLGLSVSAGLILVS